MFLSRYDCYPLQRENGSYIRVKRPLTLDIVQAHLRGLLTMGAYVLDLNSHARWLCLDADDEPSWEQVKSMASQLHEHGMMMYLESSRRGGHAWLFTPPTPGKAIRQFGKALIQKYELGKIELYPKQDHLTGSVGSLVRLPFGIHRLTGRRYHFVTSDNQPLAPTIRQQIAMLAAPILVLPDAIKEISAEYQAPTPPSRTSARPNVQRVSDGALSERLKRAISVQAFVSQYVELDQQHKGLCPFHNDQIKSFQVNDQDNYWHCYAGCGGGSIVDFWVLWRRTHGQDSSFTATIKDLASLLL